MTYWKSKLYKMVQNQTEKKKHLLYLISNLKEACADFTPLGALQSSEQGHKCIIAKYDSCERKVCKETASYQTRM